MQSGGARPRLISVASTRGLWPWPLPLFAARGPATCHGHAGSGAPLPRGAGRSRPGVPPQCAVPGAAVTWCWRPVTSRRGVRAVTSSNESRRRDAVPGRAALPSLPPHPLRGRLLPPPRTGTGDDGSGDDGRRSPPLTARFSPGGTLGRRAPPPVPAGRRLSARCCAASSPASACAGAAPCPPHPRGPPGPCHPPCPLPVATGSLPPPVCLPGPSTATCRALTAPTVACTAVHTWPGMRSSSPSPSRAATAVPTCSTPWLTWAAARPNSAFCSLGSTLWLISSARTAKPPWAGNTLAPEGLRLPSPQEQAFESSQKYKEGKFIIEMSHMVKENGWD